MVTTACVSAEAFMGDQPHFVTWTVEGSGRTWCACHPNDRLPFSLAQIQGEVDLKQVFRASTIEGIFVDGLKVIAIVIQPDSEIGIDQSMVDTVRLTGRKCLNPNS